MVLLDMELSVIRGIDCSGLDIHIETSEMNVLCCKSPLRQGEDPF